MIILKKVTFLLRSFSVCKCMCDYEFDRLTVTRQIFVAVETEKEISKYLVIETDNIHSFCLQEIKHHKCIKKLNQILLLLKIVISMTIFIIINTNKFLSLKINHLKLCKHAYIGWQ